MIFLLLPKWGHQPVVRVLETCSALSYAFSTRAAYLGMSSRALLPALEGILCADALISSKAAIFNALAPRYWAVVAFH